jgi:peptidoglycan hydrolase-like protein with peptidoglycan-binding domain
VSSDPHGSADGIVGPRTEDAVKRLQAQMNLVPDGIVSARTHSAIARQLAFLAATDN